MSSSQQALEAAIAAMTSTENPPLFDVTIICTTDDCQASYWMTRLASGLLKNSSSQEFPMVLAVSEDWGPGGAGNGLGTLYAFEKASKLALTKYKVDLVSLLKEGKISAALYHTAGKGTRLAPLPASENNNKPGVRLPVCHTVGQGSAPVTVLEAVVKQTGVYSTSRRGRLSVFWGDQIFVPSVSFQYEPTHHVDILCTLLGDTAPTAEEWKASGLDKYGVIAVLKGAERNAAQVEKVDHATAVRMLQSLGDIGQVGPSLGSFSVSAAILLALLEEFKTELTEKTAKLDTDPDFWMPLTLSANDYAFLMEEKGIPKEDSLKHHARMSKMKEAFDFGDMGLFGAVNVGNEACWWDYGQLKLYSKNNLKFLESDSDADLLRQFFGVTDRKAGSTLEGVTVDDVSCVFDSKIGSGSTIANSAMAAVVSPHVEAKGALIVNCTAKKIVAPEGAILYNLIDTSDEGIVVGPGDVQVAVTDEAGEVMIIKSNMDIDGKEYWKKKVGKNAMTFEEINKKNNGADISVIEQKRMEQHKAAAASF